MKTKICSIFGLVAFVIAPFAWADDESGGVTQQPSIPTPDPAVAEFARGVKFTVNGYCGGDEVQTNFPVLVRLSTAITGFDYGDFYNASVDPYDPEALKLIDIGFVDAQTNGLPYEIDTWNTNGESLVWVNLPEMTNGTVFAMWYRSSKTGKALNPDNVWTNYAGVWHFRENYGAETASVSVYDSTTNELTGTTIYTVGDKSGGGQQPATIAAADCNGKLGRVRRMGNNYHDNNKGKGGINVLLGESESAKRAAVDKLTPAFSGSFWLYGENKFRYPYYVGRKKTDGSTAWGFQSRDDKKDTATDFGFWSKTGGNNNAYRPTLATSVSQRTWAKIDFVYTAEGTKGKGYLYKDGVPVNNVSVNLYEYAYNGGDDLYIGGGKDGDARPVIGLMDEVRLCYSVPTPARVKADFDTVDNASFLTRGTVITNAIIERPVVNFTVADIGASHIQFGGTLSSLGSDQAKKCTFYAKVWPTSGSEPEPAWTPLASNLTVGALSGLVKGLTPATAYSYKLKITNDDRNEDYPNGVDSYETADSFTTSGVGVSGAGGDVTRVGDDWIHYFRVGIDEDTGGITNAYVFVPPSYATNGVRALVVGGGGPGGYNAGGGGGAGGYIYNAALTVTPGADYAISVGTGGVASASLTAFGSNGGSSSIDGTGVNLVAVGGGAGGNGHRSNATWNPGQNGGSGGGAAGAEKDNAGTATPGQGNNGGKGATKSGSFFGGGGGGAGGAGDSAILTGNNVNGSGGGVGLECDITGIGLFYAGGGGAGSDELAGQSGSPGSGGSGIGGTGSRKSGGVASAATQGVDGTGSGGGGGCGDDSNLYKGGDGGDGIVIIRYASQGDPSTVPEPIISLKTAVCNDTEFTGDVTFRVAWAGYNSQTGKAYETADVKAVWGYAANSLNRTNDLATGVIGLGAGAFSLKSDKRTVYVRLLAVNADGVSALSSETLSFYVNENESAEEEVLPSAGDIGMSRVDGAYATVTGLVDSAGMSHSLPSNCTVRVLWGTSPSALNRSAAGTFEVGAFSLDLEGLSAAMTYYYDVELEDDEGNVVAAVAGESFTTLGASVLNAATITSDQRILTLTGSLSAVGGGVTYILVKWNNGEWEPIGQTFTPTSDSLNFSKTFTTPKAWGEATTWAVMCSNAYVTAEGVPTGASAVSTPSSAAGTSGSFTPVDAATYTWKAVDGNWNGNWNDPAHWSSNKADCVGFPNGSGATVSFLNCTTNNPVVVTINGAYEAQFIRCFGQNNASDITFVGTDRTFSKLKGRFADWKFSTTMYRSDSRLVFRNMIVEHVGDNELMRDTTTVSNMTVRLDNVTATGKNYFSLSAPYSRLEFVNATTVTCTKVSIGGTDTVCLIDDSTLNITQDFWAPADCTANNGLTVQFKGANPQIVTGTGNYGVRPHNSPGDYVRFEFAVPIGGYSLPPIQTPGNAKFAYANTNNANTPKYELVVDPDSPALKQASETFTNVLVYAAAGFYTNNMVEAIGTVPTHREVSCGAFMWGLDNEPLGDDADISTARQILLELKGYNKSNGVIFLVY